MDGSARVFDIPSGSMIDCFRFSSPVTSLALSPLGDFFATTHSDHLGIFVWANKAHFTNVYLKNVTNDPKLIQFPDAEPSSFSTASEKCIETQEMDNELMNKKFEMVGFSPLNSELVNLSELPRSKWETLSKLDVIKERNKPKQPVKKNKEVPFFLDSFFSESTTSTSSTFSSDDSKRMEVDEVVDNVKTNQKRSRDSSRKNLIEALSEVAKSNQCKSSTINNA